MENPRDIVYLVIGLFIGMILHEYMHGRIADALGDPTPRNNGRLTLNPIPHIDPFGTLLIPLVLLIVTRGAWMFGYAKPVPINPFAMKNPRKGMMMTALAGPLTNFIIAFLFATVGLLLRLAGIHWVYLFDFFFFAGYINLVLGFFNLIPVPPLDGSHILSYFLPLQARRKYESIAPFGFVIIIGFLAIFGRWFFQWMGPIINVLQKMVFGYSRYIV